MQLHDNNNNNNSTQKLQQATIWLGNMYRHVCMYVYMYTQHIHTFMPIVVSVGRELKNRDGIAAA